MFHTSEAFRRKFGVAYTSSQPSNETARGVKTEVQAGGSSNKTIINIRRIGSYDELQKGMPNMGRSIQTICHVLPWTKHSLRCFEDLIPGR